MRRKIYLSSDLLLYNSSFVCSLNLATMLAKLCHRGGKRLPTWWHNVAN
ncbi:hypothetical protein [Bacteroides intestinalis]|nr:hypothetical protein [Bacteroides intestinalis]